MKMSWWRMEGPTGAILLCLSVSVLCSPQTFAQDAVNFMSTTTASESCLGPSIPSQGETIPLGDIILRNGTALEIYCILHENLEINNGLNASNLYFWVNKTKVSDKYVSIINETTIRLYDPDIKPSMSTYFCKVSSQYEDAVVCPNQVAVGFEPQNVLNFTCVSENWVGMNCTWVPPINPIPTKYKLLYRLPGRNMERNTFNCPQVTGQNFCYWGLNTEPQYRVAHEYINFIMIGENRLKNKTFPQIKFHNFAHVKPKKPELIITDITVDSALVKWKPAVPMQNFPPGLKVKIEYKSTFDSSDKWTIADTSRLVKSNTDFLLHLPYRNTIYDVRLYLASALARNDNMWSEPAFTTFRTLSSSPGQGPKTDVGSFDIKNTFHSRDVTLYWQQIPKELENGNNFHYRIIHIEINGKVNTRLKPFDITKSYAKFLGLEKYSSYKFVITAENDMGQSEETATIFVPSNDEIPPTPPHFTKFIHDNGVYELTWLPVNNVDWEDKIKNYTIFMCSNDQEEPDHCTGMLHWIYEYSNVTSKNISVETGKLHHFAIAANSENASSGMLWSTCTLRSNSGVDKLKNIWINNVGPTYIEVHFKFECLMTSKATYFKIYYCPIVSPTNSACKNGFRQGGNCSHSPPCKNDSDPMFKIVDAGPGQSFFGNLTGLQPYTIYKVFVTIKNSEGLEGEASDPHFNTTLDTAPSPPRDVAVHSITNDSFYVSWNSPEFLNGKLAKYIVEYNGEQFEKDHDDNQTQYDCKISNLMSFTFYNVSVVACTKECSNSSAPVEVRTAIGAPGKMKQPSTELVIKSYNVSVSWEPPLHTGGYTKFYEILIISSNNTRDARKYKATETSAVIKLKDCVTSGLAYKLSIRAVNKDDNGTEYYGPWSETTNVNCLAQDLPSTTIKAVIWIFASIFVVAMGMGCFCGFKRVWSWWKKANDIEVKLPPGLAGLPSVNEKDKDDHLNISWNEEAKILSGSSADEERLLESKDETVGSNPSGESSGCSSGHDSVSSSVTSRTQISDSGTEVDQRSQTPDVFSDSPMSLRQRNVLRTGSDGKSAKCASLARSTPNLTDADSSGPSYSCLGAWPSTGYISMPSSDEATGSTYCRIGDLEAAPHQPASKGYVSLASMADSPPPNSAASRGYIPWIAPPPNKDSNAGRGYIMSREFEINNKQIPLPLLEAEGSEEDINLHEIVGIRDSDEDSPDSYCRIGCLVPEKQEQKGAAKPNLGYVTLSDGQRPECSNAGQRAAGSTSGYVPHRHFEKRDPVSSPTISASSDEPYVKMYPPSPGDDRVKSPTTSV